MNFSQIIAKLGDCWEKVLCIVIVLLCILFCILGGMFYAEVPEERILTGRRPAAVRLLPWDALPEEFLYPQIPLATEANPFAQSLVNHLVPEKKTEAAPEQPKEEPKKEVPVVVTQTAPPPEPPKKEEPPPKPDVVITLTYKGFYVDLAGDAVAFVSASSTEDNSNVNLTCKAGTLIFDRVSLESISEESATFKAVDGTKTVVPWNASGKITFKQ